MKKTKRSWSDEMDRDMEQHPESFGMVLDEEANPVETTRRVLWCERNESSASAHGHDSDCYMEVPR